VEHFIARVSIEIAGGFISEHHCGPTDQGASHGHALLLSSRKLVGSVTRAIFQSHGSEFVHGSFLLAGSVGPPRETMEESPWEKDIFKCRQLGEELKLLKDKTQFLSPQFGCGGGTQMGGGGTVQVQLS